jgi:hypothetical protein
MTPSFSGHETFPLRFTWLAKAVEAATGNPDVFGDEAAIATFGVGRNMVRSIKHWGLATGVLEAVGRGGVQPTDFGRAVFGPNGADPYCEDPGTLWVLHWHLCREAGRAALWHYVFGHWRGHALDLRSVQPPLVQWLDTRGVSTPSASTLKRDLQTLAGTYAAPMGRVDPEDAVACPLTSLGLLYRDGGALYLHEGRQRGLPPEVFAYAVLDYWALTRPEVNTLSIEDVLHGVGAPGRAFLLTEVQAADLVARAERLDEPPFRFRSTAGVPQLYRDDVVEPATLLDRYYRSVLAA